MPDFILHISPLTVYEFLYDVLVAEAAAQLILDDMHDNETKGLPQINLNVGVLSLHIRAARRILAERCVWGLINHGDGGESESDSNRQQWRRVMLLSIL